MEPLVICFTGISGSGKSTLANEVIKYLKRIKKPCQLIDGDELRGKLGGLFGYTREERIKNSMVVQTVTDYLIDNNITTVISIVAPYEEMRQRLKKHFGVKYIQIYVNCSFDECQRRDTKGYYNKVSNGKMRNLNGANDVYEEPTDNDLVLFTEIESINESVEKITTLIQKRIQESKMKYQYITDSNLTNRQNYMYSEYKGVDFLDSYYESRSEYILEDKIDCDVLISDIIKTIKELPIVHSNTQDILYSILCGLEDNELNWNNYIEIVDKYIKAFEVRKLLYNEYQSNTIKPIEESKADNLVLYILLSFLSGYYYSKTGVLKYINVELKINDVLISERQQLSVSLVKILKRCISLEYTFYRNLVKKLGLDLANGGIE